MSWIDRLRENLTLTSPEGNVFTPKWSGNPRNLEKKIGIFEFPKVRGAIVQDLDVRAKRYSMPFSFDGPDHDIEAQRFADAAEENGVWSITHPLYGEKEWQLLTLNINDEPIESGNITRIETEWIEPLKLAILPSAAQLQGQINSDAADLTEVSADQIDSISEVAEADNLAAFKGAVEDVVSVFQNTIQSISEVSASITAEITAIKRGIDAVLQVVPLDVIAVAGQIQALVELPARTIENVEARLDAYENFARGVLGGIGHETPSTAGRNRMAVKELAQVAAMSTISSVIATGKLDSRAQAISTMETILTLYNDIINDLDESQAAFENSPITVQYFSQSATFSSLTRLVARALALILTRTFNLSIEKRFRLKVPRVPAEIAISEYNDISPETLDFFLETNDIHGDEIYLLPAGREVVVYV